MPDVIELYSKSVLETLKEHEFFSLILTLSNEQTFLHQHVPKSFFERNTDTNEDFIIERIKDRETRLVLINHRHITHNERIINYYNINNNKTTDSLLSKLLKLSKEQNFDIIQVIPFSMVNPSLQQFDLANSIYCSKRYYDDSRILKMDEYSYKVKIYEEKEEIIQIKGVVGVSQKNVKKQNKNISIYGKEFNFYSNIRKINNKTELSLFVEHLREIHKENQQEQLFHILRETLYLNDNQNNFYINISDDEKNEYVYKISRFVSQLLKNDITLFENMNAFFLQ